MRSKHYDTLAILCIFAGWFLLDTLTVRLGSLQQGVRFFDMAAVLRDPSRIFFGVEFSWLRIAFGFLCIACLVYLANGLARRGGGMVARHLRAGAGAYLAFAASLVLAVRSAWSCYWVR